MVMDTAAELADESGFSVDLEAGFGSGTGSVLATAGFGLEAASGLLTIRAELGRSALRGVGGGSGAVVSGAGVETSWRALATSRSAGGLWGAGIPAGAGGSVMRCVLEWWSLSVGTA